MEKPVTHWMFAPLRKYATFGGRAQRAEYWWFWLFSVVVVAVLAFVDLVAVGGGSAMNDLFGLGLFSSLAGAALALPSLAVQVRRLHDQDKSGWFILLGLIPLVGGLILFWLNIQRGTPGPNRFGDDPLDQPKFFT